MFSMVDPPCSSAQALPTSRCIENFFYKFAAEEEEEKLGIIEMMQNLGSRPGVNKVGTTIAQIDSIQNILKSLEKKFDEYESMTNTARERQILAERKLSQQTELLHQALESVDTALNEKNKALAKLISLDQCLDTLGDNELETLTDKLFQDLETWVEENYGALRTNIGILDDRDIRGSLDSTTDEVSDPIAIFADISQCIFNVILCRFMVGTGNPSTLDQAFRILDTTLQDICKTRSPPAH
ncbi:hypothetical protein N7456_002786 [Penicillium angulare]|uniref:Uncharacterized protein n=1 Tax=Penicillium angulare TaxID=116970 RepID=A0A9W9KHK7_9EURO|nr:hypothetical protein N7456_002786 [Penicillium angulare]